jgi:methyl-accepting chemotaxis protein
VQAIADGGTRVEEGVRLSDAAKIVLDEILESARDSSQRIMQIAQETDQQITGVQRVNAETQTVTDQVRHIVTIAQTQSRLLEEVERISEQMQVMAQRVTHAGTEHAKGNQQVSRMVEMANRRVKDVQEFVRQRRAESEAIVKAVRNIGRIGQENRDAMNRTTDAVDGLLRAASRLEEHVSRFKLTKENG